LNDLLEQERYNIENGVSLDELYKNRFLTTLEDEDINNGEKLVRVSVDILTHNQCNRIHTANFPVVVGDQQVELETTCLQDYSFKKEIAQGTYGTVVTVTKNNKDYAIKIEKIRNQDPSSQLKETSIQTFLSKYDICPKCYGTFTITQDGEEYFCTVVELMHDNLYNYLYVSKNIQHIKKLYTDIYKCIQKMHTLGFIHVDLKPHNCLVNLDAQGLPTAYLTDFGSSCLRKNAPSTTVKDIRSLNLPYELMQYDAINEDYIQFFMFPHLHTYFYVFFNPYFEEIEESFNIQENLYTLNTRPEMIDFWFSYCVLRTLGKSEQESVKELSVLFPIPKPLDKHMKKPIVEKPQPQPQHLQQRPQGPQVHTQHLQRPQVHTQHLQRPQVHTQHFNTYNVHKFHSHNTNSVHKHNTYNSIHVINSYHVWVGNCSLQFI